MTNIEGSGQKIADLDEPLIISIDEIGTHIPKYESSIPSSITKRILAREQLPSEVPPLGSSIMEDFIVEKLKDGIGSEALISAAFVNEKIEQRIISFFDKVKAVSDNLDWDNIFTLEDANLVKEKILDTMKTIGISDDQIAKVAKIRAEIGDGIGGSSFSDQSVYANRLQAVRRAMDYVEVFGNNMPLEKIVSIIMLTTIGHEIGHIINKVVGIAVNSIPYEKDWEKDGQTHENKEERFAEFWGRVAIEDEQGFGETRQKEWILQLSKVNQLWSAIATYNETHEEKADLMMIFGEIKDKLTNVNVIDFFEARRGLYGLNEVESYASPYSLEVVKRAVSQPLKAS